MRGLGCIVVLCCGWGTMAWGAEPSFPYTAEVAAEKIEVRCGPGWDYYATDQLKHGTKVDVYRHEPGGWLAIRPPEGSFSWLPARQVRREPNAPIGEVSLDGAVAWVGSSVASLVQHKWQVRLQRGELVEIVGEKSLSIGPGFATETYLQIAPPAGEFRWIHAEYAVEPVGNVRASSTRTIRQTESTTAADSGDTSDSRGWEAANRATRSELARRDNTNRGIVAAKSERELAQLAQQVEQLKIDLSLLVAKQIDQWDLEDLRARTETLTQSAQGTPHMQDVRLLSHRIKEFETLLKRHQRIAQQGATDIDPQVEKHGVSAAPEIQQLSWQTEIEAALTTDTAVGTAVDSAVDATQPPGFDAEGWLMPVHSTRRVAPPFALLDDDGRVLCYVAPAPGFNLRRYTKKYVGVFGDRQFVNDLRASLITVTRVVKQK